MNIETNDHTQMSICKLRSKLADVVFVACIFVVGAAISCQGQQPDTSAIRKNVIRYNLSGSMLFGVDQYVVLGYERVVRKSQSFSVNFGRVALPKVVSVDADPYQVTDDVKNSGFNFSVDYRFYLPLENRYPPPRGLYIGPYASYNQFDRENKWGSDNYPELATTETKFKITTVGFQIGYQFLIWQRLAIDLLMIGPGIGYYDYNTKINGSLTEEQEEELLESLGQLHGRIPGLNAILSDEEIEESGSVRSTNFGYRYIIHIGYAF